MDLSVRAQRTGKGKKTKTAAECSRKKGWQTSLTFLTPPNRRPPRGFRSSRIDPRFTLPTSQWNRWMNDLPAFFPKSDYCVWDHYGFSLRGCEEFNPACTLSTDVDYKSINSKTISIRTAGFMTFILRQFGFVIEICKLYFNPTIPRPVHTRCDQKIRWMNFYSAEATSVWCNLRSNVIGWDRQRHVSIGWSLLVDRQSR